MSNKEKTTIGGGEKSKKRQEVQSSPPPIKRSSTMFTPKRESILNNLFSNSLSLKKSFRRSRSLCDFSAGRRSIDFSIDDDNMFTRERASAGSSLSTNSISTTEDDENSVCESSSKRVRFVVEDDDDDDFLLETSNLSEGVKNLGVLPPVPFFNSARCYFPSKNNNSVFETPTRDQVLLTQCMNIDASQVVKECLKSVRLVIFDFDKTLIDIHTKGRWESTPELLAAHIRPVFRVLFPLLLKVGLPIGIATFSPQETLVEEMISFAFKEDTKVGENMFIRGCRKEDGGLSASHDETGKRRHVNHILACLEEKNLTGNPITASQILFVDDDISNVFSAKRDGLRVVHFENTCSDDIFLETCISALQ